MVLNDVSRVLNNGFSRMASALENNSRMVKLVERATKDQSDILVRAHRSIDRLVDQKKSEERWREKENDRPFF